MQTAGCWSQQTESRFVEKERSATKKRRKNRIAASFRRCDRGHVDRRAAFILMRNEWAVCKSEFDDVAARLLLEGCHRHEGAGGMGSQHSRHDGYLSILREPSGGVLHLDDSNYIRHRFVGAIRDG